jgi:hypothetical protein
MARRLAGLVLVIGVGAGCGGATTLDDGTRTGQGGAAGRGPGPTAGVAGHDGGRDGGAGRAIGDGGGAASIDAGGVGGSAPSAGGATGVGGRPGVDGAAGTAGVLGDGGSAAGVAGAAGAAGAASAMGGASGFGGAPAGLCADPADAVTWFVDCSRDAGDTVSGRSWDEAMPYLQHAADRAGPCDQIWIRAGLCRAQRASEPVLEAHGSVRVFGGFSGVEAAVDERPAEGAPTILDGDFLGDDGVAADDGFVDNSTHVVLVDGDLAVVLDGLTLRSGHAEDPALAGGTAEDPELAGGGVLVSGGAALRAVAVTFEDNRGVNGGALAVVGDDSAAAVEAATFTGNTAEYQGAGVHVEGGSLELRGSSFYGGEAPYGGAISGTRARGQVWDTTFVRNYGLGGGGGARLEDGSWSFDGCTFLGNSSPMGGAIAMVGAAVTVSASLLAANTAVGSGGALFAERAGGTLELVDSVVVGNDSPSGTGGGLCFYGAELTVERSSVVGNRALYGAGMRAEGDVVVRDSEIRANRADQVGGGLMLDGPSSLVVNAQLAGNWAQEDGSAALLNFGGEHRWVNVDLTENRRAGLAADAVTLVNEAQLTLQNSLVYSAGAVDGGVFALDSDGQLDAANDCAAGALPGEVASVALTDNPLAGDAGQGDFLQLAGSPCQDAGDDTWASAVDLPFSERTTLVDESLDVGVVDAGYHHAPSEPRLEALTADLVDARWTTAHAAGCVLGNTGSGELRVIEADALAAGELAHGAASQAGIFLVCWDAEGRPKAAWTTVP